MPRKNGASTWSRRQPLLIIVPQTPDADAGVRTRSYGSCVAAELADWREFLFLELLLNKLPFAR